MDRRIVRFILFLLLSTKLLIACGTRAQGPADIHFSDVPSDSRWGIAINELCNQGYFAGRSEELFDPSAPLTRAEAAVLIVRLEFGTDYSPPSSSGEWWVPWVDQAVSLGFMSEPEKPDIPATRADIATLLWLMEQSH